jgi:YidC/Oxa1 family membrane protein insertase
LLLLLLLVVAAPLGLSGCGVPGVGSNVSVPADAEKALAEGQAKEAAASKAAASNQTQEAARLYNEAASYYGAVAGKFRGTDTARRALLIQARLYAADPVKNYTQAQQVLRTARREYPADAESQQQYEQLIARMDRENSETPYYKAMDALVNLLGGNPRVSPVLALFVISIGVTLALWPLRAKQYRGMKEMQRHQPELKRIQEKYKDDRALQQEKVMELYKEHGFNPMAGCLPMLAQMPVLWLLYHAISLYQFQFTKSTFLWINPAVSSASRAWPSPFTGAIAPNLGEQDLLLLLVYALSMYFQTKLTPAADPAQAEQQKVMALIMPAMFFVMMLQWHLPSAFVLYWFLSNVLMVGQQWWINRSIVLPPPPQPAAAEGAPLNGAAAAAAVARRNGGGAAEGGGGMRNGGAAAPRPMAPNQKLISPKNRKNRRK